MAVALQALYGFGFLLRQDFGYDFVDSQFLQLRPRRVVRLSPVSITTRTPSLCSCRIASALRLLIWIGDTDQARGLCVNRDENRCLAILRAARRLSVKDRRRSILSSSSKA